MEQIISSSKEFVVLDIETSHFHPSKGAMIIEIGAVKIRDGKIIDEYSQLIDPERNLTKKITEITGITNEMLKNKPTFRKVLPEFYNFIGNAVIVAHNSKFDWNTFLLYFFKKVGVYPTNKVVDTLTLSRKYLKDIEGGYSLGNLCKELKINIENAHRALDDTKATAELFLHIKDNFIQGCNQLSLLETGHKSQYVSQRVRRVQYWEKEIKVKKENKLLKRVYVTLDRGVVFFDIPTKAWEVKSSNEPINLKEVEDSVLSILELDTIDDLISHYS